MIEYKISTDEETDEIAVKRAVVADNAFYCLSEIQEIFRQYLKYRGLSDEAFEVVQKIQQDFAELLEDQQIDLDYYYG